MRARLYAVAILFAVAGGAYAVRTLARPLPAPPAPTLRLPAHLHDARQASQRATLLEPEVLRLQPGSLKAPEGWQLAEAASPSEVAHLVAAAPRPLKLPIEVPVEPGRDYLVRALVRDPSGKARLMIAHAPTPEQPQAGWHHATDERAGTRVRFDWREELPPGRRALTVSLEADSASELTIESLTVREAGERDPSIVDGAPSLAMHALVERPVDGLQTVSPRGIRRQVPSLLASDGGVYEWPLASPPPTRLDFESAIVPRGAGGKVPVELRVEVLRGTAWELAFSTVRGNAGDGGGWRFHSAELRAGARALRLSTRAVGSGRPIVVAWGQPTLRPATPPRAPHVLLITLDAVRPDHLSAYGYARATSPFLAELAKRGARFEDVTAQRGHTWASTTSLVSGLYPDSSGVVARGARPYRGVRGVVDAFAAAGYTTGRIGSPDLPKSQISGFDFAESADYDNEILARLVRIGRAYADRPLFLWVHLANAHYPWKVLDEFNRFDPGYHGRFASGLSRAEFHAVENAGAIDEAERKHLEALYDGSILQMDSRLGQSMAELDDAGFFKDAIVAVSADHGTHLGEQGVWFLHSTPWRASLHVPLVIVAPGRVPAGVVVPEASGRALLIDLGPTLLELAGVPGGGLDGVSLRPLWSGGRLPARTTVTHFQPASYALVENDRYSLFYNPANEPLAWPGEITLSLPMPALGLYDRVADPSQQHDLSTELPLVVGQLRAEAEAQSGTAAPKISTEARLLLQQAGYADEP